MWPVAGQLQVEASGKARQGIEKLNTNSSISKLDQLESRNGGKQGLPPFSFAAILVVSARWRKREVAFLLPGPRNTMQTTSPREVPGACRSVRCPGLCGSNTIVASCNASQYL